MSKLTIKVKEQFKTLYLSKKYSLSEIAQKTGIARTSVYKLKNRYFPGDKYDNWRRGMFVKLHEAGTFSIEEITGLLGTTRTNVLRFKRQYEKFNKVKT